MKEFPWNDEKDPKRVNFIARVLGIIGEDVTKCWLNNEQCPFRDYGRPTIQWEEKETNKKATLDFLFQKKDGQEEGYYIVEQKNFFAYNKGNLRVFEDSEKFRKSYKSWDESKTKSTPGWRVFKDFENKEITCVGIKGINNISKIQIIGSILIWSEVNIENNLEFYEEIMKNTYIKKVIGLTSIIEDLISWEDVNFNEFVASRMDWLNEIFEHLRK